MKHVLRDCQQVGASGTPSEILLHDDREVLGWCQCRHWSQEDNKIHWPKAQSATFQQEVCKSNLPKIVVFQALPQHLQVNWLSIMHHTLSRIFSHNAIHKNLFFSWREPAFLTSKTAGSLASRRWQQESGDQSDDQSQQALRV